MVHTRGQKMKEENDTKLAQQQSLAEQVQQTSVSKQLPHELEAATVSQQDLHRHDVLERDSSQVDIAKSDVAEPDVPKPDVPKSDVADPDIPKPDIPESDVPKPDVVQQHVSPQEVVQQDAVQQNTIQPEIVHPDTLQQCLASPATAQEEIISESPAKLDLGRFASDSTVINHSRHEQLGDDIALSSKFTETITQVETDESGIIHTENGNEESKSVNNVTMLLEGTTLIFSENRSPASSTSRIVSDKAEYSISEPVRETEHANRYSLRSRVKETGKPALAKVEAFVTTSGNVQDHSVSATSTTDDGSVITTGSKIVDEFADLSVADAKGQEDDEEYQPKTTRRAKKQSKATSKKIAINKIGIQQKSTVSEPAPKNVDGLVRTQGTSVQDDVQADVSTSEGHLRAKSRSISKGKRFGSSVKNTKGKRKATTVTRTGRVKFDIPVNSEDEDEFVPENGNHVITSKKHSLRDRTKISGTKKKALATTRSRTTKSSTASPFKKTRAAKIVKERRKDTEEKKLMIKLILSGKYLADLKVTKVKKVKKNGPKKIKVPKGFFSNDYRFKFDWTPFEDFPNVEEQRYQDVHDLLAESLAPEGISLERKSADDVIINGVSQGPMHAGDSVTVDALVKVIMSQATTNTNALSAQARLQRAFPYLVDGETIVGETANYHDIRLDANADKLRIALATAGLQNKRAPKIAECLNEIRRKNIEANSPGCIMDSNPPNTAEFFPGSLSLEYLNKLTKQEKMDELLTLPLIGIKTAMCVLAFAFGEPVFAVDTHVHRLVSWLGWVPENTHPNDAAAHLDMFIPDSLKYGLHQGFWHHGQKCIRCKAGNDEKTEGWKEAVCVLEEYLKRQPRKERKSPERKRKKEADDGEEVDSPKPKVRKGNKTMISKDITDEEAAAENGWHHELKVDDNFGTLGANYTGSRKVFFMEIDSL